MKVINGIPVFGNPLQNAVDQISTCSKGARYAALMADHHLGYSLPVGGVIAYKNALSPSGVGADIACGTCAVRLDVDATYVEKNISSIMDSVFSTISFGVGRKNNEPVDHDLFDDPAWEIDSVKPLKQMARDQLGTVGSGNHYVDIFRDEQSRIWIGVHFGSRGLGHKIATHYVKAGGGKDGIFAEPVILEDSSTLGKEYVAAMNLAGRYAYAGRDWVCDRVARIIGGNVVERVHNHHNFAWRENHFGEDLWVIRKGATPAFPSQKGFVGGTMGEDSVILEGVDSETSKVALYSTVHGAGRVMSRTEALGRNKYDKATKVRSEVAVGKVSQDMMDEWVGRANVCLRGGGRDESPHCYKRLSEVLAAQGNTIRVLHTLTPLGVAMAGKSEFDPYRD